MSEEKKKVLVADDSETFVMYMCILLKRMGYNVIPAGSGLEALRLLRIITPDLVMLDINMPALNGIETLRSIKDDGRLSSIPVVMVSVDSNEETREKCRGLGCSGFLTKPLDVAKLHDSLQEHIFSPLGWKRRHVRVGFNRKVAVQYGGTQHKLYAEALSEGGIYIIKKEPFPVGAKVEVVLPMDDGRTIRLDGTVIYIKGLFGDMFRIPPGMAIEFKDVSSDDSAALHGYVSRLIAEDIIDSQEEDVITIGGYSKADVVAERLNPPLPDQEV